MSDNKQGLFFFEPCDVVKKNAIEKREEEEETAETGRIGESQSKHIQSFFLCNSIEDDDEIE